MSDDVKVRVARAADIEGICDVLVDTELCERAGLEERVRTCLERSPDTCFVVCVGDALEGVALASFNGFHLFLGHMAVRTTHQGAYLGQTLHEALVVRGRALGAKGLITDSWLTATGYYFKLGYRLPGAVFMIHNF